MIKTQQEFINVAAHELRTPIQPIIALSDLLLHKIRDGESLELIDVIFRSAKRLQRLSQDVLDITKIESGLFKLNKEPFDLKQVIFNVVDDYRNQIKNSNKNIRLVHEFDKKEGGGEGQQEEQLHNKLLIQDNDTIIVEADKVSVKHFAPPNAAYTMNGNEKYVNSGWLVPKGQEQLYPGASTTFTVRFQKAGTYSYICQVHPWMRGTVIVK